jgi:short-chain fatty acids transporter
MDKSSSSESRITRTAQALTAAAEAWMPDAFVFALVATTLVALGALCVDPAVRESPLKLVEVWGSGFWSLIPFTLQMAMILIGGYLLASAPIIRKILVYLAGVPRNGKSAAAWVALLSMLTSLLNWGFSLIFSALLAKEIGARVKTADYRVLGAASLLGLGTVWAQGLSGSAALQVASSSSIPKSLTALIPTPIPLTETIFLPNSIVCVLIELVVVTLAVYMMAPSQGKSAEQLGISPSPASPLPPPQTPGERLEHSPWPLLPFWLFGGSYLIGTISSRATSLNGALSAIDFNTINLFFLVLGSLLHWTPASLMRSVREATPGVWGILLQFPFYGGIAGIMTGTQLSHSIAGLFVAASSPLWYPAIIATYSTILGVFIPSGGSKWVVEAPYILTAGRALGVADGWVVVGYDLGEAVANLLQPFWMLPTLALLGLKARDIIGFTWTIALVVFPLVLVLLTLFAP